MKKNEIAALREDELKFRITELKKQIYDARFSMAVEPPQNKMIFRNLRKEIARVLTQLNKIKREGKK